MDIVSKRGERAERLFLSRHILQFAIRK
jgi:hypothetical protein